MINIVLVDDHDHIRKAIWYLLQIIKDIEVVATASNGAEAVMAARFSQPDVVLMDISMPVMNGIEATRRIVTEFPGMPVLMLSSYDTREYIEQALEAGAQGYIVKEALAAQLVTAIRALYTGERYFCREIADTVESYLKEHSHHQTG